MPTTLTRPVAIVANNTSFLPIPPILLPRWRQSFVHPPAGVALHGTPLHELFVVLQFTEFDTSSCSAPVGGGGLGGGGGGESPHPHTVGQSHFSVPGFTHIGERASGTRVPSCRCTYLLHAVHVHLQQVHAQMYATQLCVYLSVSYMLSEEKVHSQRVRAGSQLCGQR